MDETTKAKNVFDTVKSAWIVLFLFYYNKLY